MFLKDDLSSSSTYDSLLKKVFFVEGLLRGPLLIENPQILKTPSKFFFFLLGDHLMVRNCRGSLKKCSIYGRLFIIIPFLKASQGFIFSKKIPLKRVFFLSITPKGPYGLPPTKILKEVLIFKTLIKNFCSSLGDFFKRFF